MSQEIARLEASPVRRWFGILVIGAVGLGVIYVAFATPPASPLAKFVMPLLGAALVYQAYRNLQATQQALVLTEDGLWIEGGAQLFSLDNVQSVSRTAFAMKPSNGFSVKLNTPVPFGWSPGVYWCVGRSVGIGGATDPAQAKAMAEALSILLANRQAG
jgi:hypothetical protein